MYSPEQSARILLLRAKVNDGSITPDELKEGLALLRSQREGAHAASAATKSRKAAKAPVNSNDLLSELGDL